VRWQPAWRGSWTLSWLLALLAHLPARADAPGSTFADYQRSGRVERTTLLPFRLDAHGVLTWEADVGAGLRIDVPILKRAGPESAPDEVALSFGADMSFINVDGTERLSAWPTIMGQWTLGVSKRVSLYPELGLVARIQGQEFNGIYPNVGFGGRMRLYEMLGFGARLGWPMAVSISLTFQ
jgi:hypothetical protein